MCAASPRRGLTASGNVESMVEMVSLSPSRILRILMVMRLLSMCLNCLHVFVLMDIAIGREIEGRMTCSCAPLNAVEQAHLIR